MSFFSCDAWLYFQAHELPERVHDIDLEALDGKTVSEVIIIVYVDEHLLDTTAIR